MKRKKMTLSNSITLFSTLTIISTTQCYAVKNGFVDFGIRGTTYTIQEENGQDLIDRRLKEINFKVIENDFKRQIDESFTSKELIKESEKDNDVTKKDFAIISHDIISPLDGTLIYREGDKIPSVMPNGLKMSVCFVNGGDKKEVVDWVVAQFKDCSIFMVNNMDSRKFEEIYKKESYPIGGQNSNYIKAFEVETLPTMVIKQNDTIQHKTLNIIKFKREFEEKGKLK